MVESLLNKPICFLSAGSNHSAALSVHKELFLAGSNDHCQLGHQDKSRINSHFTLLPGKFEFVECGNCATFSIDEEGEIWAWGRSFNGLIPKEDSKDQPYPLKLVSLSKYAPFVDISSKGDSCGALTADGSMLVWGFNHHCNLLPKENEEKVISPSKLEVIKGVDQICFTKVHAFCVISQPALIAKQYIFEGNVSALEKLVESSVSSKGFFDWTDSGTLHTSLHYAVSQDRPHVIPLLFKHNVDISKKDVNGDTAVHLAASMDKGACMKELLKHPQVSSLLDSPNNSKLSPLHLSVLSGSYSCCQLLLEASSDRRVLDSKGRTPLTLSVIKKYKNISTLLVNHASPISLADNEGKTALDYCTHEEGKVLSDLASVSKVFISYAHKDITWALQLRYQLEKRSIRAWIDESRLVAGGDWRADIAHGVLNAQLLVFIASKTSVHSDWCMKELQMAKKHGKAVLPIIYQHSDLPKANLPLIFQHTDKLLDLSSVTIEQGCAQLVKRINNTLKQIEHRNTYWHLDFNVTTPDLSCKQRQRKEALIKSAEESEKDISDYEQQYVEGKVLIVCDTFMSDNADSLQIILEEYGIAVEYKPSPENPDGLEELLEGVWCVIVMFNYFDLSWMDKISDLSSKEEIVVMLVFPDKKTMVKCMDTQARVREEEMRREEEEMKEKERKEKEKVKTEDFYTSVFGVNDEDEEDYVSLNYLPVRPKKQQKKRILNNFYLQQVKQETFLQILFATQIAEQEIVLRRCSQKLEKMSRKKYF